MSPNTLQASDRDLNHYLTFKRQALYQAAIKVSSTARKHCHYSCSKQSCFGFGVLCVKLYHSCINVSSVSLPSLVAMVIEITAVLAVNKIAVLHI